MRKQILALALVAVLVFSFYVGCGPQVFADYSVLFASFPPELPADIDPNGAVGAMDLAILASALISEFGDPNWDPRADLDEDGKVNAFDLSIFGQYWGSVYDVSPTPVAYSSSFEFVVPIDGDALVWYYMLVRLYVPAVLSGQSFRLVADKAVDDCIRKVRVDTVLLYSGEISGLFDLALGQLQMGFHLLELEYGESIGGGVVNFSVKTAGNQPAWFDRYRIYVPNYSDAKYEYTVNTTVWCTMKDDYFLIGYADDFIDDVHIDGSVWKDWMWDMGAYGALYAWGDGFCYPLGNLENNVGSNAYQINFVFGEMNASGLLDFQYISRSNQKAKIGAPKFYCKAEEPVVDTNLLVNDRKIYGGSTWYSDAGTSPRLISVIHEFDVSLPADSMHSAGHNSRVRFQILLGWIDADSPHGTVTDFGIGFNVTHLAHNRANTPCLWDSAYGDPATYAYLSMLQSRHLIWIT